MKFDDAVDKVRRKILGKLNSVGLDNPGVSLVAEFNQPLTTAKTIRTMRMTNIDNR